MNYQPTFEQYSQLAREYSLVPIYRQLLGDSLTPVSVFAGLLNRPHSFLFESVIGGEKVGRYSFLSCDPFLIFQAFGTQVRIEQAGVVEQCESANPFSDLQKLLDRYRCPQLPGLPRFIGGAVGYAAYDAIRYLENLPATPLDDRQLPDLSFAFYDRMFIFDHISKLFYIVVLTQPRSEALELSYHEGCARLDQLVAQLEQTHVTLPLTDLTTSKTQYQAVQYKSNFSQPEFETAVEKCKEYIRAGDFFQIVLSQRFEVETTAKPFDIYRCLRVVNPSPFMVYLSVPQAILVASSPEILVRVEEGQVTSRPLAGTRPRGANEAEDRQLVEELRADAKEVAEHVMLVDLGRNDLGRVCNFQSVQLSDELTVEKYSHVMHLTSNVTGQLKPRLSSLDALLACLPAGTVSGAPKVRAMQVIDELEPCKRGPYAGAIGYIDFTGNMDTCIALRTLVIVGSKVYAQAGAGIVYDSVPSTEYQETLNKARGLFQAIAIAEHQAK